ncbi:MFS transporter [Nonomuraea terrae]|uniref:MFS transporter n=1 Tax=Nonomuraea terrae TaxID=2530383 RepID=A0A4R4Z9J9_9ACTN|nr:MFS transporter [Nonomuraea terrae]TDD54968.1 MFS transporter [Nonomuraea terrae]
MSPSTSDIGDIDPAPRHARLPRPLRPFRTGQYRLLATALGLSLAGSGMWAVAVVWQVIAIGGGPSELSLIGTAGGVGLVATALLGGVVADRASRRRIILLAQSAKAMAAGSVVVTATMDLLTPGQLIVVAVVLGIADGFFYPAYSALVPAVVPQDDLLTANGIEGMLRPTLMQAAGPGAASTLISAFAPSMAFAGIAGVHLLAATCAAIMREPEARDRTARPGSPVRSVVSDLRAGFAYLLTTPWLVGTLAFAVTLVLVTIGPIQVLLPFTIRDQGVGGPQAYALALACYGLGGVIGSLTMSALTLPRRYLSVMLLTWGGGCLPLAVLGAADQLWAVIAALFLCGALTSGAGVIWGTLLQRRVPPAMLGRVSSLDFFVSLSAAPLSMALVGPAAAAWGSRPVFLVAAVAPLTVAVLAIALARLRRDEIDHPLTRAR